MNTLAHTSAFIALLWVALYVYRTLLEPQLGFAILGVALAYIPLTFIAIDDDCWVILGVSPLSNIFGRSRPRQ